MTHSNQANGQVIEGKVSDRSFPLNQYVEGLRQANTAVELEAAIQAPYRHSFRGRTWATICKVRIERGLAVCDSHSHGKYVPRMEGRSLVVCGETYKVGRGMNSTGVRYVWHYAEQFAISTLMKHGFSRRAVAGIWDWWDSYPHRCLDVIQEALAGNLADPELNVLKFSYAGDGPVKITVEENAADEIDRRATQECSCGGTLFDWGSGYSAGFTFVNWRCNACQNVYIEYVSDKRFAQIRSPRKPG